MLLLLLYLQPQFSDAKFSHDPGGGIFAEYPVTQSFISDSETSQTTKNNKNNKDNKKKNIALAACTFRVLHWLNHSDVIVMLVSSHYWCQIHQHLLHRLLFLPLLLCCMCCVDKHCCAMSVLHQPDLVLFWVLLLMLCDGIKKLWTVNEKSVFKWMFVCLFVCLIVLILF